MSASSYLGVSVEPTLNFFSSDPWGSRGISLTPSVGSKDPTMRLESGGSWGVSVLIRASSSEAKTAEASSQLSISH